MKKIGAAVLSAVLLTFSICGVTNAYGAVDRGMFGRTRPEGPITVDGDEVEYFEREKRIVAEGNVKVTYGDVTLKCDRIEIDTEAQQALCTGNVIIEQPSRGTLTGDRILYDLALKRGRIDEGELEAYPWFAQARVSERVSENEYVLRDGFITTCDHEKPHYRLKAQEVTIYPNDKVIARNVVMYMGKIPVMWFPYYYHPIIQNRPKVQLVAGRSSDWGAFLLSSWRFHTPGNTFVDLIADYRSRKGFAEGANLYYDLADLQMDGLGAGLFRSYFIHQNAWGTHDKRGFDDGDDSAKLRKRFQWKHRAELADNALMMLELNKLSDRDVLKHYFYNEFEQTGGIPDNYVSFVNAAPNYTFSVEMRPRFDGFYTVTQKMPEIKLVTSDQRLAETPFYYAASHTATVFDKAYAEKASPREQVNRLDSYHRLSYVTKLGPVNLTPFGTFRNTSYTRRMDDTDPVNRISMGGGINAYTRFYRIYDVHTDAFGLEIDRLRHLISPQVEYTYLHKPSVERTELYQMDGIDDLGALNVASFRLENKLQTKRGADGAKRTVDLVRFITGVDLHLDFDDTDPRRHGSGMFRDLNFALELRPYDWLFIDSGLDVSPQEKTVSKGFIEAILRPTDSFVMNMAYWYEKQLPASKSLLTFDASYRINPKWKVGLYERFDLERGVIEEQQLSVTRDLHCWEVDLSYNVEGGRFFRDEYTIWLAFRIKAFPDLQLGMRRTFSKRPPGSMAPGAGRDIR